MLEIRSFGGLSVTQAGEPVTGFISNKVLALLLYLAVTRHAHRRDALAGLLWGEMAEADARNNLRQALSNLRKLLGAYLVITRTTVAFCPAPPFSLDVEQFERLWRDFEKGGAITALEEAVSLYRGEFLAGFYLHDAPAFEEWMLARRERCRSLALHALHILTEHYLHHRRYGQAIDSATRLLALDSWREETHRQLMLALVRSGQHSAALAQYETCRRILEEELGVAPSAETTALYERIRAAGDLPRHNLPAPTTALIGREEEMACIQAWLSDESSRLLTIGGPGGVGKTRLALQVAWAHTADFLEGVWFVPLDAVSPGESLAAAIAAAVGFRFPGRERIEREVLDYLRDREMLLLLDNLEHLLNRRTLSFLASLLAWAPGIQLLVTSQERLDLQAETLLELAGLACPGEEAELAGQVIASFPAGQLFLTRARQVRADFRPAGQEAALVRLCRLVGGLPLALELAASWVRVLDVAGIVAEIEQGLGFLQTKRYDLPERHRSLVAVFERSWQRLTPQERQGYARLSLFRGGLTAEAAREVVGANLPLLAALVDRFLLYRQGERYQFHPLLRQFAADKLAADPAGKIEAERAHARYYGRFVRRLEPVLLGGKVDDALARIRPELDNLRLAWQTAIANREIAVINDLADSSMQIFDLSGLYQEMRDLALQAVGSLEGGVDLSQAPEALALGRAYGLVAAFSFRLGEYEQAMAYGRTSIEIIAPFRPHVAYGHSLVYTGAAAYGVGDIETAIAYWQQGVAVYRQVGSRWGECAALANLAEAALARGDTETSRQYATAACALARQMENAELVATTCQLLAVVALNEGALDQAMAYGRRALALHRQVEHQAHIANALAILARIAVAGRDHQQALAYLNESVAVLRRLGNRRYLDLRLTALAQVALEAGELETAEATLQEMLRRADWADIAPRTLEALLLLAQLRRRQGKWQESFRLATSVAHHKAADDEVRAAAEECRQAVASQLTADEIATAESAGLETLPRWGLEER